MLPYQINAHHALPGNWPTDKRTVPGWLLDKLAQEKMDAGYDGVRNPVCTGCWVRKANNGSCNC